MNLTGPSSLHQARAFGTAFLTLAIFFPAMLPAGAQETKAPAPKAQPRAATKTANPVAAGLQEKKPEAKPGVTATNTSPSPIVKELLKLADAGVSKDVMKGYLQGSAIAYEPKADDLVALKQRGVADDVTTALLKRAIETRKQADAQSSPAMPDIVRRSTTGGQIDPESYDFWYLHYAYPRALSYSYKTLAPYQPHYPGKGNRYNPMSRYPEFRR